VRAEDAVPNLGPYSNTASATTPAPPDTEPPSAPGTLGATAISSSRIDLSWGPASDNVGVSRYRIERCQGSGCSSFTEIATTPSTSYSDTGLSASTAYSYRVRAEDAVPNLGPYSNTASATTLADVLPPVGPLLTLDSFNRANENPLSFGGRWGNGILGSGERGLKVDSNLLAGGKTATTTAWWKPTQLGPDSEAFATIATLPGNGNSFRLYVRLQAPGSSAVDGYMLLFTQSSGTDQVALYRVTNGALIQLAAADRAVAAGTVLLLRAKGNTLESWVREGATWTRVGYATDSAYPGAGYAGVGIRGKTGRLDDFGAR